MAKRDYIKRYNQPPPADAVTKAMQVPEHTHPYQHSIAAGISDADSTAVLDVQLRDTLAQDDTVQTGRIRLSISTTGDISEDTIAQALYSALTAKLDHAVIRPDISGVHGRLSIAGGVGGVNVSAGGSAAGVVGELSCEGAGKVNEAAALQAKVTVTDGAASIVSGLRIAEPTLTAGKVTDYYGILVKDADAAGMTNGYSIYTEGNQVLLNANKRATADVHIYTDNNRLLFIDAGNETLQIGDTSGSDYAQFASDGLLTLAGTARVTVDMYVSASGVRAPGLKPATFIPHGICGAWQFADATLGNEESVSGTIKLPSQMDKAVAPTFKIGWSADGSSPGNCRWKLEYLYRSPNEDTTAGAQATLFATGTASVTSNGLNITAFAALDLPSATDQAMFFRATRMSADPLDTITDTTELRGLLFTHTRDKLGTAT